MPAKDIKSGPEIVEDFLASLESNSEADERTLAVVRTLVAQGNLTPTRLIQKLAEIREEITQQHSN